MQTLQIQHVGEALDRWLMRERGIWVVGGMWRFRRVLIDRTMDTEKLLGLAVERLQIVVAERPRGSDTFLMAHLLEVAPAKARQTSAIHLGVPAHPVVNARLERLPGLSVIPGL